MALNREPYVHIMSSHCLLHNPFIKFVKLKAACYVLQTATIESPVLSCDYEVSEWYCVSQEIEQIYEWKLDWGHLWLRTKVCVTIPKCWQLVMCHAAMTTSPANTTDDWQWNNQHYLISVNWCSQFCIHAIPSMHLMCLMRTTAV